MSRQSMPSTGQRAHGGDGGRGGGRGRGGRGRGRSGCKDMNSARINQLPQQCAACHKNINRLKKLQSKAMAGLLCLDEMTSVVAKLHVYLEQIQSDVGDVIEDLSLNADVGGQICQRLMNCKRRQQRLEMI